MRVLCLCVLLVACSSPPRPTPELPPDRPVAQVDAGAEAEVDPDPAALAALAKLDEPGPIDERPVIFAISILARQQHGLDPVLAVVRRKTTAPLAKMQVHAMRELAKRVPSEPGDRDAIVAALLEVVQRGPADFVATDAAGANKLFVLVAGPAFEALADLHAPEAVEPALLAMLRHPPLFAFVKRALVAAGPEAKAALVAVLEGKHAGVERAIRDEKLDRFCPGPFAATKPQPCKPLSSRDHYAADVLGHFYDPATVPALLAALKRKPQPYYYLENGKPGERSQHLAIFEALRRIGAPEAARPLEQLWSSRRTDALTRLVAVASYPFVTDDRKSIGKLAQLVAHASSSADLRREAAIAISRQSRDLADIKTIRKLASSNKDYRMLYLAPIPRIAIAVKCKDDLACYAAAERMTAEELVALVQPHMPEIAELSPLDREELSIIAIDRAAFELRRAGAKATPFTRALLDLAASDRRELRHFGSLALPRVAPSPCPVCVTALDKAILNAKAPDAVYDLTLVRDHFFWSGQQP